MSSFLEKRLTKHFIFIIICIYYLWEASVLCHFKICLAGKIISVDALFDSTRAYCKDYLTDSDAIDISVSVSPEDLELERVKSEKEQTPEDFARLTERHFELTAVYRKIAEALVDYNIILFHGSCVAVDGEAFIFSAKSGTGKSTHTRLWRERYGQRCVMINDDKPLIEVRDDEIIVWGTPWNGKHRLSTNTSARLSAICVLERAVENSITRQSALLAFPSILSQTYRFSDVEKMRKTLALLQNIINKIEIYKLGCNMDISAAETAYNGMRKK